VPRSPVPPPGPARGLPEIVHNPVPHCRDQRNGSPGDGLPGRLDGRAAGAGNHLHQHRGVVLAWEGALGQLLEQRGEDAFEGECGSQQLLDERPSEVDVASVVGCAGPLSLRGLSRSDFAPRAAVRPRGEFERLDGSCPESRPRVVEADGLPDEPGQRAADTVPKDLVASQ
jgi:hypothetical protein